MNQLKYIYQELTEISLQVTVQKKNHFNYVWGNGADSTESCFSCCKVSYGSDPVDPTDEIHNT